MRFRLCHCVHRVTYPRVKKAFVDGTPSWVRDVGQFLPRRYDVVLFHPASAIIGLASMVVVCTVCRMLLVSGPMVGWNVRRSMLWLVTIDTPADA